MRPAVAMLELIFALVVMGIVLMSAPRLSSAAAKSGFVALQQEAIAATAAEMGMVLSYHWDESNTDPIRTAQVLTTLGSKQLEAPQGSDRRQGTPSSSARLYHDSLGKGASATQPYKFKNEDDFDDIDDFTGKHNGVISIDKAGMDNGDTIDQNIKLETDVEYLNDTNVEYIDDEKLAFNNPFNNKAPKETSNIKWVKVTLTTSSTSPELSKTITLNAFSCNIGSYRLNKRTFN